MKPNFGHNATTSFTLWLENFLLDVGEAYKNFETKLYFVEDERMPEGFYRYSSPYKQWVFDQEKTSIPVIKGGSGNILDKKSSKKGYFVDYQNGGIVFTGDAIGPNLNPTAQFSVKDFNIYNTNETEESLIVEQKFENNSRFYFPESGIEPYSMVTPAVFVNSESMQNQPFAFGGEDKTTVYFKCVILTDSLFQLDGILSLFCDAKHRSFPECNFDDHPINEYGDLKNEEYKYKDFWESERANNLFNIDNINTSKLNENANQSLSPTLSVGFADFEVSKNRFPRIN